MGSCAPYVHPEYSHCYFSLLDHTGAHLKYKSKNSNRQTTRNTCMLSLTPTPPPNKNPKPKQKPHTDKKQSQMAYSVHCIYSRQ